MRQLIILLLCALSVYAYPQVWTLQEKEPLTPGTWYVFRNTVELDNQPRQVKLSLAADTKYWLWINGELQMAEGGLKRGPNPADTYCDVITCLPALRAGENTVAVLVWYFGKEGFSHRNSPTPGISFSLECDGRQVAVKHPWKARRHPAYYVPQGEVPNFRLAESNIGFDASEDIPFMAPGYSDKDWKKARKVSLEQAGWNRLVNRPIPFWKDFGLKAYPQTEMQGDSLLLAYLPYNAQITPYIRLKAPAGKCIRIRTDNYLGGSAPNVFAEYLTREGEQEFECRGWMNGHHVRYELPEGVEVLEVKYRETGYDTSFAGSFTCDDPFLTSLWNKAQRTLYITMRDTYMDCPDRERAQWWGDVVNELGEAFYALDEKAHLLTRKGIHELMGWQRADSTIFAPVPAGNYADELPMQMLASVSHYGFWTYYMGTGDRQTIEEVFPRVQKYIHVWKTDSTGLVVPRSGGWTWGDWGENKDMTLLFNLWYVIALKGYEEMAVLTGNEPEALWARLTADRLKRIFHRTFWNGKYYLSSAHIGQPDDRAQALAVLAGVLPEDLYPVIRPFFTTWYHASPYMEKYVLEALCVMGYHQDALNRMRLRYRAMVESPLTTLWEGWRIGEEGFGGGTYNHAWSGGPLTILSQYIAGIETVQPGFKSFRVEPHLGHLNFVRTQVPLAGDRRILLEIDRSAAVTRLQLEVPEGTSAELVLPREYRFWTVNGTKQSERRLQLPPGVWKCEMQQ